MSKRHSRKRHRLTIRRRETTGVPPGSLVVDPQAMPPKVRAIAFGPAGFEELTAPTTGQLQTWLAGGGVTWVDVEGLADLNLLRSLANVYGLHGLALEDVVNVHQRPKAEQYQDQLFLVARMPHSLDERLHTEQVSLFLGRNFVLTFQEGHPGDSFGGVRQRIRSAAGRIRELRADYLAYSLIDAVIDAYFPYVEHYSEALETLEDAILRGDGRAYIGRLHELKGDLLVLRRTVWQQRDALNVVIRDAGSLVTPETLLYLRDCHDHTLQLVELVETEREVAADLLQLELSMASNRMAEVTKVLTVVATVFIPLTFVAGVYGMNFDPHVSPWNMPELHARYGYPAVLAAMGAIALAMGYFFRRRGWIGPRSQSIVYERPTASLPQPGAAAQPAAERSRSTVPERPTTLRPGVEQHAEAHGPDPRR